MSRWIPAASMMLVVIISYIDRNTLALLAPTILKETGMNAEQFGYVVSAFSIAFMVANPLWGWVLDRTGLRRGMACAVALWSLASVAHVWAGGFLGFFFARAALGLGEGAASPGGLRAVTQTLNTSERSRGIAMTFSGGSAGAILTPILMTPIALRYGWRGAFWATGILGIAWLIFWLVLTRRAPWASATSQAKEMQSQGARPSLADRRVWAFLLCYSLGALPLGFIVYSAALYLDRAMHLSQKQIGAFLWIPPLGSEVGIFFWGFLMDRLARSRSKLQVIPWMLPLVAFLSLPIAAIPLQIAYQSVLAQFFFAMFVASGFQLLAVTYATELFSIQKSAWIGGLCTGAYGATLAIAMPNFGRLFDQRNFQTAFAIAALVPVIGYLFWLALAGNTNQAEARA